MIFYLLVMSCHNNETSKIMATCWSLSAEINSSGLMALEGATDHEDKINKNTWLKHNERVSHYPSSLSQTKWRSLSLMWTRKDYLVVMYELPS